jgi:hypothetical protein
MYSSIAFYITVCNHINVADQRMLLHQEYLEDQGM